MTRTLTPTPNSLFFAALVVLIACCPALTVSSQESPQEPAQESALAQFQSDWAQAEAVLLDKTIAESTELSDADRHALTAMFANLPHGASPDGGRDLNDEARHALVKVIDLGSDTKERFFVVRATANLDCSPTGNCKVWIFRRRGHNYSYILEGATGQTVAILPSETNGLRDVVLSMHGSATMSVLKLYKLESIFYRHAACYEDRFEYLDSDGEIQGLDEPRITPCKKQRR